MYMMLELVGKVVGMMFITGLNRWFDSEIFL